MGECGPETQIHSLVRYQERRRTRDIDQKPELFPVIFCRLDVPYVFLDPSTGRPYKECQEEFAAKAKIDDFHFHGSCHTFASHLNYDRE